MHQVIVNEENAHDTKDFINKRLSAINNQRKSGEQEDLALIIGENIAQSTSRYILT
jgi:phospholipid-transporting ATPase